MAAADEPRSGALAARGERSQRDLSLGALFEGVGKTLASLAGLAVFVYVVGGLTVVARLQRLELPAETIVPELPRERLALLGLSQVLWTLVLGGLIAGLALYLLPDRLPAEPWAAWRRRVPREARHKWLPGVALLAVIVLLAPWSANGGLYLAALLLGVGWFVGWGRQVAPTIALVIALGLAGAVTVLRQLEFPSPFNNATVALDPAVVPLFPEANEGKPVHVALPANPSADDVAAAVEACEGPAPAEPAAAGPAVGADTAVPDAGPQAIPGTGPRPAPGVEPAAATAPSAPPAGSGTITGRVIEITDSDLLLGYESSEQDCIEDVTGERLAPKLLIIPRDSVERIFYSLPNEPQSHADSIAQKLFGVEPVPLPLMCLIPTCEWDETEDEETNEPTASPPFVF